MRRFESFHPSNFLKFYSNSLVQIKVLFTTTTSKEVYKDGDALSYQTPGSSGFDLRAIGAISASKNEINMKDQTFSLLPSSRVMICTGIVVHIPDGYEIQVRSRSSLAWKHGVSVLNSPGTVDSDYRGEIRVILHNQGTEPFLIQLGDRIAQAVVTTIVRTKFSIVENVEDTERGSGGFGSTGIQ